MARILVIENETRFHSLIMEELSPDKIVDNFDDGMKEVGYYDFVVTDLFMPGDSSFRQELEELLRTTDPEKTRHRRWGDKELRESLRGLELPMGLLVAQECVKRDIPVVVATDGDHHEGAAYLPIGCAGTILSARYDGKSSRHGGIVDRGAYRNYDAKASEEFWEWVKRQIEEVNSKR